MLSMCGSKMCPRCGGEVVWTSEREARMQESIARNKIRLTLAFAWIALIAGLMIILFLRR